ncbi:MAG: oligosaccharide flippase family protein [Pseudomonadota bacterium]
MASKEPSGENVTTRTAMASAALVAARLFSKSIDLILLLILARILVPEDFALIAMAMIFIQFTEAILEIPVVQAIIRAPKITDQMLDTAFTISFLRALLVMGIVCGAAPLAVVIFDEPRLGPLMMVLSLSPALRGLVNPRLVIFARALNYGPEASIEVIAKFITTCVALPLAIVTESYWSLAIMTVVTPVTMMIGSYIYAPYRPRLTLRKWSVFSNMIGWTSISQIFVAANWQVDIFALARGVNADIVGKYSISQTLAGAPYQVLIIPIMRPFIAAFTELKTPAAMAPAYLKASSAIATLMAPVLILVAALAGPIVTLVFNEAWDGAGQFLSVLALSAIISLPVLPVASVVLALDKAKFNAMHAFVGLSFKAPLLFLGLYYYGVIGFLAGHVIAMTIWTIVGIMIVRALIGVRFRDQIIAMSHAVIGGVAMVAIAAALQAYIDYSSAVYLSLSIAVVGTFAFLGYWLSVFVVWSLRGKPDGIERLISTTLMKLL